jgi:hypothetical protein
MSKNKLVLASFIGFAMLAVAATKMVTQETYAQTQNPPTLPSYPEGSTCPHGEHESSQRALNGMPCCVSDTGKPPEHPFPGCAGAK